MMNLNSAPSPDAIKLAMSSSLIQSRSTNRQPFPRITEQDGDPSATFSNQHQQKKEVVATNVVIPIASKAPVQTVDAPEEVRVVLLDELRRDHSLLRKLSRSGLSQGLVAPCLDGTCALRQSLMMRSFSSKTKTFDFTQSLKRIKGKRDESAVLRIAEVR
jgi:hypothetical protein